MQGSLWRVLLELQDGQGRTPLHVAQDHWVGDLFVEIFDDADEEMLICALTARDRAGKSPLHRGRNDFLILQYFEKYEEVRAMWHATWRHPLELFGRLPAKDHGRLWGDGKKDLQPYSKICRISTGFENAHMLTNHSTWQSLWEATWWRSI